MDYTIDADAAKDALLRQMAIEADLDALANTIEVAKCEFCQGVRVADGKERDFELDALRDAAADSADKAAVVASDRNDRMARRLTNEDYARQRTTQLEAWLPSVETEHAQHAMHVELAVSPEQVEASTVAMIVCEAAVLAGRSEHEASRVILEEA